MSQQGVEASAQVEKTDSGSIQGRVNGPMGALAQRCYSCGRTMMLGEGDTLFGNKWFHGLCWTIKAEGKR